MSGWNISEREMSRGKCPTLDETGFAAEEAGDVSGGIRSARGAAVPCTVGQYESVTTAKRRLSAPYSVFVFSHVIQSHQPKT